MRIVKPNCLSVLPRCIEHRRELFLCVSTFAMVPLREAAMLCSEQKLWTVLPQAFPEFVEAGAPKKGGEFLLAGAVHAPPGSQAASISFGIRFAGIEKIALAHGRRFTDGQAIVHQEHERVAGRQPGRRHHFDGGVPGADEAGRRRRRGDDSRDRARHGTPLSTSRLLSNR